LLSATEISSPRNPFRASSQGMTGSLMLQGVSLGKQNYPATKIFGFFGEKERYLPKECQIDILHQNDKNEK